jgi:histidine ammonia-lyase
MAIRATVSRTPNYDSLHRSRQVSVDRNVLEALDPDHNTKGPKFTRRHPNDIDLFRELYAIKYLAERQQRSLEFIAMSKEEQEAVREKDRQSWIRRFRNDATSLPSYMTEPLISRRKLAISTVESIKIQF